MAARRVFENLSRDSPTKGQHRDHPGLHRDHPDLHRQQADRQAQSHNYQQLEPVPSPETHDPTNQIDGTPKKRQKLEILLEENVSENVPKLIKQWGGREK